LLLRHHDRSGQSESVVYHGRWTVLGPQIGPACNARGQNKYLDELEDWV
jgi:hypothetical protein